MIVKAELHKYKGFWGTTLEVEPVTIIGWFGDTAAKAVYLKADGTMNYEYMSAFIT